MKNIIKTQFQGKLTSSNTRRNDDSKMVWYSQNQFCLNEHEIE